jgi:hypothetical protein
MEEIMKKNVGLTERIIRIIVGGVILSLAFIGPQTPWAYLGLVPLLTGLTGWCPPYTLLGISTCKKEACDTKDGGCCGCG